MQEKAGRGQPARRISGVLLLQVEPVIPIVNGGCDLLFCPRPPRGVHPAICNDAGSGGNAGSSAGRQQIIKPAGAQRAEEQRRSTDDAAIVIVVVIIIVIVIAAND
jgi:hypothetical protein